MMHYYRPRYPIEVFSIIEGNQYYHYYYSSASIAQQKLKNQYWHQLQISHAYRVQCEISITFNDDLDLAVKVHFEPSLSTCRGKRLQIFTKASLGYGHSLGAIKSLVACKTIYLQVHYFFAISQNLFLVITF